MPFCNACLDMYVRQTIELHVLLLLIACLLTCLEDSPWNASAILTLWIPLIFQTLKLHVRLRGARVRSDV